MRALLAVAAVLLALAPRDARAVELEPGWSVRTAWDSNVFRTSEDEESDFSVLTGPELRLRERTRAFDLDLGYRLLYEEFIELDGIGSFQHFQDARVAWRPTPVDTLRFDQGFSQSENLLQILEVGAPGLLAGELVAEREKVSRNYAGLEYRRRLGPLWEMAVSANNTAYWFESDLRSDSLSTTGAVDFIRTLSLRQSVGVGVALTHQDFDDTEFSNGSATSFAQIYGIWNYRFSKTINLGVSAGPRLAVPDDLEDTGNARVTPLLNTSSGALVVSPVGCPAFAPGVVRFTNECVLASTRRVDPNSVDVRQFDFLEEREEPDSSLSYFGRIALSKEWETVTSTLSFERSAGSASGLSTSTDLNSFSFRTDWRPRRAWRFVGIATYEQQSSTSDIPLNELLLSTTPVTLLVDAQGRIVTNPADAVATIPGAGQVVGLRTAELVDNAIDFDTTRLELRVHHDITPRITVSGLATWYRQDSAGEFQSDETIDTARVELVLTWRLAPIDL